MLIECSRCHAVFSLQEGIAAAGSRFSVQCGRCQAVFEAMAAAQAAAPLQPPEGTPAGSRLDPGPPPLAVARANGDARALPAVPERSSRARWLVPLAFLALASAVGIVLHRRERARELDEKMRAGEEKLLLDDTASLQEATRLFTEVTRAVPGRAVFEAERAFALLLQGGAQKDLAGRLPGPEGEEAGRAASRLLQQGAAAARQAVADDGDDPVALRAMALAESVSGAADQAWALAEQAERAAPGDAWALYTKAAAAAAGHANERAVQALSAARQAEPRLLRADIDLAAISLDRGDPSGARELLASVLRRNPQHDRARRILALLPP